MGRLIAQARVFRLVNALQVGYADAEATHMKQNLRRQLIVSVLIGGVAAIVAFLGFTAWGTVAADFTWSWRAAQAILDGQNPYDMIRPSGQYPYNAPFYYPLPAALVAVPFTIFPATIGGALFIGVSTGILAYALLEQDQQDQALLILLSAPYFAALRAGQWSPLLTAAMILPALAFLLTVKPNLGLAGVVYQPRWRVVLAHVSLVMLASLLILPTWPLDWLVALQDHRHDAPIASMPGTLMLLALLRWRDPRARLLLALSIFPQRLLFYDQLPLLLVAKSLRARLILIGSGWAGFLAWQTIAGPYSYAAPPWVLWFCYVPALGIVLAPLWVTLREQYARRVRP